MPAPSKLAAIGYQRPGRPRDERARLTALRRLRLLDTPPQDAFDRIVHLARDLFNVPIALISLIDEHRQWFKSRVGLDIAQSARDVSFCAHAILGDDVFVVPDTHLDARFAGNPMVQEEPHIRFYASAPLVTRDGYKLGTLCVIDRQPRTTFGDAQLQDLRNLAALVMAQIELQQLAGTVDLGTGLYNTERMVDDLQVLADDPSQADNAVYAMVLKPLRPDYLIAMEHALGHARVARFVQAFVDRIEHLLPQCRIYHATRDRLGFIVEDIETPEGLAWLRSIIDQCLDPLDCEGVPIRAQPRVGLARLGSGAGAGRRALEEAMAAAVDATENGWHWMMYDGERHADRRGAFLLLSDLPAALEDHDQLFLEYQPQVDLRSGTITGAEALVRWRHPRFGTVAPGRFIAMTEQTNLMPALTNWVVSAAARQMAAWRASGLDLKISVNVSVVDLLDADFVDRVTAIIATHDVPPDRLMIELTESVISKDLVLLAKQLRALRDHGIQIAIDDFGTGASNLSYLKRIPANTVKIDQSFVRSLAADTRDQAITRTMIELAHQLGYHVVAEGVEDETIRSMVARWGCDQAQGYAIARPMPADQLPDWVRRYHGDPSAHTASAT